MVLTRSPTSQRSAMSAREVMADGPEERVLRGQAAFALEVGEEIAHRHHALAVPRLRHFAVRALLFEHGHDVLAVDDLGMVIDAENARHAVGAAREFEHRHAVARFVFARDDRGRGVLGDQIEEAVVDDAEVAAVGQTASRSRRTTDARRLRCVSTFSGIPLLFSARNSGRAAPDQRHIRPKLWQTPRSAADGCAAMSSKRRNSGASQAGFSAMPWLSSRHAVVHARIEMAGTAGADVEPEAAVRRLRDLQRAAHVVRQHAHLRARGDERARDAARRIRARRERASHGRRSARSGSCRGWRRRCGRGRAAARNPSRGRIRRNRRSSWMSRRGMGLVK